jgi:hypothetical protein
MRKTFYGPYAIVAMDQPSVTRDGEVFVRLLDRNGDVIGQTFDLDMLTTMIAHLNSVARKVALFEHQDWGQIADAVPCRKAGRLPWVATDHSLLKVNQTRSRGDFLAHSWAQFAQENGSKFPQDEYLKTGRFAHQPP